MERQRSSRAVPDPTTLIAAVVLAAGGSRRMGRPKMLLPAGEGSLLSSAVEPLLDAGLAPVVVVLGCEAEAVRRNAGLPADPRLVTVVNESWAEGMSSSLRRGVQQCGNAPAVLVALGDQPGRSADEVRRIREAWRPGVPLVVPVHEGRAGHPVLFAQSLWDELRLLTGDVGARSVVQRHWHEAVLVPCHPCRDIDNEEDYRAFLEGLPAPTGEGLPLPDGERG